MRLTLKMPETCLTAAVLGVAACVGCGGRSVRESDADRRNACISNLRQIDGAKEAAAAEAGLTNGQSVPDDLLAKYNTRWPLRCPAGGTHNINVIGNAPACTKDGHQLAWGGDDDASASNAIKILTPIKVH